jgi:hypothetical protein
VAFLVNDADHWHKRAEEMRAAADKMSELEAKEIFLRIAADYDRLVARIETRKLRESARNVSR